MKLATYRVGNGPARIGLVVGDGIRDLARQLVSDSRSQIPVADTEGKIIGAVLRQEALDVLLGDGR